MLQAVPSVPFPAPPYPPDTRAGNYAMRLDMGRVHQSITFTLADRAESPPELRAWLVFLWCESWSQIPMASLPDSDELIAATLRMPSAYFALHKSTLLRGWKKHSDGRLYHDFLTGLVLATLRERARYKRHREHDPPSITPPQPIETKERNVAPLLQQRADVDVKVGSRSKAVQKTGTRLPDPWSLPDDWKAWALALRPDWNEERALREALVFRDFWHAKAGKDARKQEWFATWRNWIRRAP